MTSRRRVFRTIRQRTAVSDAARPLITDRMRRPQSDIHLTGDEHLTVPNRGLQFAMRHNIVSFLHFQDLTIDTDLDLSATQFL
jgi:hypothetical protein